MQKILLTAFSSLLFLAPLTAELESQKIDSSEIGLGYVLVGSLGYPLFKEFEIEGRIVHEEAQSHKEGRQSHVEVSSVNGTNLKEKIRVPLWNAPSDIPENELLSLEVVEEGRLEDFLTPNLSIGSSIEGNSRQVIYTGLSIIRMKN